MIQGVTDKMIEALRLLQSDPTTPIPWATRKALTDRWLIVERKSVGWTSAVRYEVTEAGVGVLMASAS